MEDRSSVFSLRLHQYNIYEYNFMSIPWKKTTNFLSHESCKDAKFSLLMNPIMSNACMFDYIYIYIILIYSNWRKNTESLFWDYFFDISLMIYLLFKSISLQLFGIIFPSLSHQLCQRLMKMSWHGNTFRITGPLWGDQWIPLIFSRIVCSGHKIACKK